MRIIHSLKDLLDVIDGCFVSFNVVHNRQIVSSTTIGFIHYEEDADRNDLIHFFNYHSSFKEPVIDRSLWMNKSLLDKYILNDQPSKAHFIFRYEIE